MTFLLKQNIGENKKQRISNTVQQINHSELNSLLSCHRQSSTIVQEDLILLIYSNIQMWDIEQFQVPKFISVISKWRILHFIADIDFFNLKQINLSECFINNIEQLSWINCPQLEMLQLQSNFILSLAPLAKTNFPELSSVYLKQNFVQNRQQIKPLNRMKCVAEFKNLHVSFGFTTSQINSSRENIEINDLFKFQASYVDTLFSKLSIKGEGKKFRKFQNRFKFSKNSIIWRLT